MTKKLHKDSNNKDRPFLWTSIGVTVLIIGLWFLTYFLLINKTPNERGTIGDMFGSINALFSGLALAGIILTILLQRRELKLQREELRDTRKEFETQNETLKLQRFENTFFNLLNLHHQIVNAIDYRFYKSKEKEGFSFFASRTEPGEEMEVVVITGRDVFKNRYNSLFEDLSRQPDNYEDIYLKHYEESQTDFGHYFRNLYRMIKLVDQTDFFYDSSKVTEKEIFKTKYRYTCIIRAQISDYELLWLFYNCVTENGIEKFKPYIEQYSFFKNLPKNLLAHTNHIKLYDNKAFEPDDDKVKKDNS